eukprot:TRINITY_DN2190_c0_g1_i1.p1 TRINITY_DN2190_c0_g1~~TRINITY_DN2190_c0_g1_i1.p1  ORF type:complete len:618 (-),score=140.47 TRINITY_DN2190_c0_g1_i1:38-1891(-)
MVNGPCCGCSAVVEDEIETLVACLASKKHHCTYFNVHEGTKVVGPHSTYKNLLSSTSDLTCWVRESVVHCLYSVVNPSPRPGTLVVIENIRTFLLGLPLLDLLKFQLLSKSTHRYFSEVWKHKVHTLFENILSVDQIHQAVENSSYFRFLFHSGILFHDELVQAVQLASSYHVIFDVPIPGAPVSKRIMYHPKKHGIRCPCHLDGSVTSQLKLTNIIDFNPKDYLSKTYLAPYSQCISTPLSFTDTLKETFPLYSQFLVNFKHWDRFTKPGCTKNLNELEANTTEFIKRFHDNPHIIPTDDILLGLHFLLLHSKVWRQNCLDSYGGMLDLRFLDFLKARDEQQQILSEAVWESSYKNDLSLTSYNQRSVREMYRNCCSLYMITQALKTSTRSFKELESGYLEFMEECVKNAGTPVMMTDLLVDVVYHIHLLHPVQFYYDCLVSWKTLVDHTPEILEDTGMIIYRVDKKKERFEVLGWNNEKGGLELVPLGEYVGMEQKWRRDEKNGRVYVASGEARSKVGLTLCLTLKKFPQEEDLSWVKSSGGTLEMLEHGQQELGTQGWEVLCSEEKEELIPAVHKYANWAEHGYSKQEDGTITWQRLPQPNHQWGFWRCVIDTY